MLLRSMHFDRCLIESENRQHSEIPVILQPERLCKEHNPGIGKSRTGSSDTRFCMRQTNLFFWIVLKKRHCICFVISKKTDLSFIQADKNPSMVL